MAGSLYKVKLIKIIRETPKVKTFRFEFLDNKKFDFKPGQFVFLHANIGGKEVKRAYSISSTPLDEYIELSLELVNEGKMTTLFHYNVNLGDTFELSEPKGVFTFDDSMTNIALIAGGSGIVPMRSISRYILQKKLDTNIKIFFSARTYDEIVFIDELNLFAKDNPNLKIMYTLTRENPENWSGSTGRLTIDMMLNNIDSPKEYNYFLCGPMNMVRSFAKELIELGIDRKKIKRDIWGA